MCLPAWTWWHIPPHWVGRIQDRRHLPATPFITIWLALWLSGLSSLLLCRVCRCLSELTWMTASSFLKTAPARGLWPRSFKRLGSAPCWIRTLTRSAWPWYAASMSFTVC
jgi:hypothetical protein